MSNGEYSYESWRYDGIDRWPKERNKMAEEKKVYISEQDTKDLINAVRAYQNGDTEAFNTVYDLSCRYLYVCIWRIMGSEDVSRDILQDTYMDIAKSISTLKQAESFLAWASVIANRRCYAHIKKNKNEVPVDVEDEIFGNLEADEDFIPENVMQDKEKQRLIREIIDGLSQMQRLCIISYYYEGKKQEEIAEELGIPLNSVKSHILRGKAKIKDEVLTIEKEQGTKLYSIAPLLLLLLNEDIAQCVLPESLREAILKEAGVPLKTQTGASAADAVQKAVRTKYIIGAVAAAAVIGGGIAVFYHVSAGNSGTVGGGLAESGAEYASTATQEQSAATESVLGTESLEELSLEELSLEGQEDEEIAFDAVMNLNEYESYGNANGNVIPVKRDGLWGAINYQKEEIVPCEYTGFWIAPDDEGTFILNNSTYDDEYGMELFTYYIFNRDGELLYESGAEDYRVSVSGGMYSVATLPGDADMGSDIVGRVSYYRADGTLLYSEPCEASAMCTNGFNDGYVTVSADYEGETEIVGRIGKMDKEGNVDWHEMYVDQNADEITHIPQVPMNSFNHGYCVLRNEIYEAGLMTMISDSYEELAKFDICHYRLQGDTLVYDQNYYDEENISWETYQIDGAFYANYGTKMVLCFGDKDVLVDLSLYPGMTYENADGRIVQAVYDKIYMSEEPYWLAFDGTQWGYVDHDGKRLQFYDDASEFCDGKALVIENGTAFLIDESFEKIKELGEAEGVRWIGDFFVVSNGESRQLYPKTVKVQ